MTSHLLEYVAEGLSLGSVVLIWWPAYKLSRSLLEARNMRRVANEDRGDLGRLASNLSNDIEKGLSEFSLADHVMLLCGFGVAVVSSIIKLGWVIGG